LNRRIRNRTYGGVRGRELIAPSYSICLILRFCPFTFIHLLIQIRHSNERKVVTKYWTKLFRQRSEIEVIDGFSYFKEMDSCYI